MQKHRTSQLEVEAKESGESEEVKESDGVHPSQKSCLNPRILWAESRGYLNKYIQELF